MDLPLLQDVLVTVVAFGCAAIVCRRVLGLVRQREQKAGCSNCASSSTACAPSPAADAPPAQHPLIVHRTPR